MTHPIRTRTLAAAAASVAVIAPLALTAGPADAAGRLPKAGSAPSVEVVSAIVSAFPKDQWDKAAVVSWCEANWRTDNRTSGANRRFQGLFQMDKRSHQRRAGELGLTWEDVRTRPEANARIAADLLDDLNGRWSRAWPQCGRLNVPSWFAGTVEDVAVWNGLIPDPDAVVVPAGTIARG